MQARCRGQQGAGLHPRTCRHAAAEGDTAGQGFWRHFHLVYHRLQSWPRLAAASPAAYRPPPHHHHHHGRCLPWRSDPCPGGVRLAETEASEGEAHGAPCCWSPAATNSREPVALSLRGRACRGPGPSLGTRRVDCLGTIHICVVGHFLANSERALGKGRKEGRQASTTHAHCPGETRAPPPWGGS